MALIVVSDNSPLSSLAIVGYLSLLQQLYEHMLRQCLDLFDREAAAKKAVKDAQTALDEAVFAQYPKLTEDEIKMLVVDDKWQATLKAAIQAEIERVTQQVANRVKTLKERYAEQLPQLTQHVEALSSKVDKHLKKMGLI